jgi:hypothetical protein
VIVFGKERETHFKRALSSRLVLFFVLSFVLFSFLGIICDFGGFNGGNEGF